MMRELWKSENKKLLDTNNEDLSPKCPHCNKSMIKQQFKDDTSGWTCNCLKSNNKHKSIILEK